MSTLSVEQEDPQRWQTLGVLAVTLVLAMSTWFSASAVVPQVRELWSLSPSSAAWLTIAVQLGFVAGAVVSSFFNLSDIIPPKQVMFGGAVGAAVVNLLLLWTTDATNAIPLRFATGFFLAGVYPPAFKLVSTWFRRERGIALGLLAGAIVVGNSMPHLVNGLGGLEWRIVIIATSLLTLLGGLLAAFVVKEGPYHFPVAIFDPKQVGRAFANRGVRLASFGYIGHMWELFAMYAWFSLFFAEVLTADGQPVGVTAAFATFAVIAIGGVGGWAGGVLANRWGRTKTAAWMMVISGSCALLIGLLLGGSPWWVFLVGLVWGFTGVADSGQFSTMVTELADQAYVGTALTLQLAAGFAITCATIWLIPALAEWVGWRWAFAFLAPGPLFGVLSMLRLHGLPEAARIGGGKR